jgi:hypothetical protein
LILRLAITLHAGAGPIVLAAPPGDMALQAQGLERRCAADGPIAEWQAVLLGCCVILALQALILCAVGTL